LATTKMHPPLPTQPHLCSQHCHRSNDMPTSFATKPVQRKWLGSTTTAAARGGRGLHGPMAFPNHLSFGCTTKRSWVFSAFIRFWDHPPRTTAWGKPVKVTHRPSAPHSRAPSWTTGHHWVPPAVERLARKVDPKSWPKSFGPLVAFWPKRAKCTSGRAPFPHKVRWPRVADPHPHRSTFRAYSRRDPLGAGQSWHSTGYWVERLWNLNLKAEARGRESRGSMGSRGLRPCDSEGQAHHAPAIEIGGGESKGRAPTRANKGPAKGHTNA